MNAYAVDYDWGFARICCTKLNKNDAQISAVRLHGKLDTDIRTELLNLPKAYASWWRKLTQQKYTWSALQKYLLWPDGFTEFSLRVYQALYEEVKAGSTAAYGQVAMLADNPQAARAVGRVMGSNNFPIIIPCHRVCRADGTIGGFMRSDADSQIKKSLLSSEGIERF